MKKIVVVMTLALLAACGKDDDKKKTNTGAGATVGGACTAAGSQDCSGTQLLTCSGGKWALLLDCATSGRVCGTSGTGKACINEGGSLDCNYDAAATIAGYYDSEVQPNFLTIASSGADLLAVEIWPSGGNLPGPGTYDLTGTNAQYDTCAFCVVIYKESGEILLANSGSVTVTSLGATRGGATSFTLTNVNLREVTIDNTTYASTDVPAGLNETIPSAAVSGVTESWPCTLLESFLGLDQVLTDGTYDLNDALCVGTQSTPATGRWVCGGDCVVYEECGAANSCAETDGAGDGHCI